MVNEARERLAVDVVLSHSDKPAARKLAKALRKGGLRG
jgi:hypothetical protein